MTARGATGDGAGLPGLSRPRPPRRPHRPAHASAGGPPAPSCHPATQAVLLNARLHASALHAACGRAGREGESRGAGRGPRGAAARTTAAATPATPADPALSFCPVQRTAQHSEGPSWPTQLAEGVVPEAGAACTREGLADTGAAPGCCSAGLPPPPAAGGRGSRYLWSPEQVEVLLQYLRTLAPADRISTERALALLGWAGVPDPGQVIHKCVQCKVMRLRYMLRNGRDPSAGQRTRKPAGTYNWRSWIRRAFDALPDKQGTIRDLAAVLEADRDIAPRLDRRPDAFRVTYLTWRKQLSDKLTSKHSPEFVNTGLRRGKLAVYRFDEQEAALADGARVRRRRGQGA